MSVQPIPAGQAGVMPYLIIRDVPKAIDWYKKTLGATEAVRMMGPDGKSVSHAEIKVRDASVMMTEENLQWGARSPLTLGGTPVSLFAYFDDVGVKRSP